MVLVEAVDQPIEKETAASGPTSNIPLSRLFCFAGSFLLIFSLRRPNFLARHGALAPAVCDDPVFPERKAAAQPVAKESLHND
jgi:hypothetical protein